MKRLILGLVAVLFLFSLAYAGDEPKVFTEKDLKKYHSKDEEATTQPVKEQVKKESRGEFKKESPNASQPALLKPTTKKAGTTPAPSALKPNKLKKYSEGAKWKWGDKSVEQKLEKERQEIINSYKSKKDYHNNEGEKLGTGTIK